MLHICICNRQRDFTYNYLLISLVHERYSMKFLMIDRSFVWVKAFITK